MLLFCLQILWFAATACVNGKVSISSINMIHPLIVSGNRHMAVQHRFIMVDNFKSISGVWGPPDFFNLRALRYPKVDAKNIKINKSNLYCTNPLDYCNFQQRYHGSPWPPLE